MDIIQVITSTDVIEVTGPDKIVEVATVGPQGPQGPAGPAGATTLDGLTDVTITTPSNGQALVYNGSIWVNQTVSTVGTLNDLTDVTITTPAAAQVLRYNGSQWVNGSVAYSELTDVPSTFAPSAHTHAAADIVSGTFADVRIAGSNVTQHQALLSIAWDQLTSVPSTFPPSAHTHVAANITDFSTAADARIAAASIDALSDVTVSTPASGQYLRWNGSAWVNAAISAGDLPSHTHTASQVTNFSTAVDARIAAANLDALANVVVPSPSAKQVLMFNGTNWVNAAVPAVTSVGLSLPSIFTVSGSPVTGTGTLTATLASQSAARVFASPAVSSGTPTFRALNSADVLFVPDMVDEVQATRKVMLSFVSGPYSLGGQFQAGGGMKHEAANAGIQKVVFYVEATGTLNPGVIVGVQTSAWSASYAYLRVGTRIVDVFNDTNVISVPWTDLVVINGRFAVEAELVYYGAAGAPAFFLENNDISNTNDITVLPGTYTWLVQNSISTV
jgi:hypothetical protein